jgi:hypothetical protein
MLKKIWNFSGTLQFTFWAIILTVLFFLTGVFYTGQNYEFFHKLNETRLQDWLSENFINYIGISWWLPLLFVSLTALGINTFICSIDRIRVIIKKQNNISFRKYFHILSPTLIHWLFMIVMAGHLITFTIGEWRRFPLEKDGRIKINESLVLTVESIGNIYYKKNSFLENRIAQTNVIFRDKLNTKIKLSYLNPVSYNGYNFHLDMIRKKGKHHDHKSHKDKKIDINKSEKENCNKADIYNIKKKKLAEKRKLQVLVTKDPGLDITIYAFILILIIMTWYYIEISIEKRNKEVKG